jgi:hypothetical protein
MRPEGDVLTGGPERPTRRRPWLYVLAGVAAAAVAVPALRAGGEPPRPVPPAPAPVAQPVAPSPLPQVPALQVAEVCPVVTGTGTLEVRFLLINASAGPVTLEAVRPLAPDLLRAAGEPVISRGGCSGALPATPRKTLLPRETRLVTFRFARTGACAEQAPVDAAVRERTADDRVLDSRAAVLDGETC